MPHKEKYMELFSGRPSDFSLRLPKEQRVYELFDSLGIEYWRVDHPHADTMEECLAIEEVLGAKICKNLFLRNQQATKFYLLIMPGDKKFKTKDLSQQINSSRLSFAEGEYMEKYLDITPGSVSIAGLMNDKDNSVQFIADEDVLADEYIGLHPCINTSTLKIAVKDIQKYIDSISHTMLTVKL